MSQENVDFVKAVHPPSGTELTSLFADDSEAPVRLEALAPPTLYQPDFKFSVATIGGADSRQSGSGVLELVEAWRDWMEPWEVYWTEVEDFIEAGDDRVLVLVRDHGRLQGTDAEVELAGGSVWTLRDRKIARIDFYANRDQALEAAGLQG